MKYLKLALLILAYCLGFLHGLLLRYRLYIVPALVIIVVGGYCVWHTYMVDKLYMP